MDWEEQLENDWCMTFGDEDDDTDEDEDSSEDFDSEQRDPDDDS